MILAKYMEHNQKMFQNLFGKRKLKVLEVGSGTGLLGIYLACLGWNVTLSDSHSVANESTQPNACKNLEVVQENQGKIATCSLDW